MSAAPVAIVAGTGGAGTAVALALSAAGHHVVLLDSRLEAAEAARATVEAAGGSAEAHGIDLLDADAVTALRSDLLASAGRGAEARAAYRSAQAAIAALPAWLVNSPDTARLSTELTRLATPTP